MFVIEKGIPQPLSRAGRPFRYPFAEMGVGDSFFVAVTDEELMRRKSVAIRTASRDFALRHKGKFATRCIRAPALGVRCWRIA